MNQKFSQSSLTVRKTITFLLVIPMALCCVPTKADGQQLPTLLRHNTNYESACTERNLQELKNSLDQIKVKAKKQAWKAISVLLCGAPTKSNQQYIATLLTSKVERDIGGVDMDAPPEIINKNKLTTADLFAHGTAFGAGIADMPNKLTITYYLDEACLANKKLEFIGNRWRLTAVGSGCD